jgi:hypothetical protein
MSLFDDIRTKAEELLGGSTEDITSGIEDATSGLTDVGDQVQDVFSAGEEK